MNNMSYGYQPNYGGHAGYEGCEPSNIPRPTGFCKRWAKNIPSPHPYVNPYTGVRRKVMCPSMNYEDEATDVDTEVEDDFWQAEEDCRQELYNNAQPSPLPWGYRQGGTPQGQWSDPATKLESLIKEETDEIEQSMKYLRHASDMGYAPQKKFRDLAYAHRRRAMADVVEMGAENLDPDVAAAMMASEEQGQALKHIPPAALFNRLFPEDNRKCTVLVRGASKYHRDHVKPERGAMLQDCLMSDVDAGIVPFGDISGRRGEEFIPQSMDTDHPPCPDGICEPKKKIKIHSFKASHADEEGVTLTWAKPKQPVAAYMVYHSTDDKPKEWMPNRVAAPPLIKKWIEMDPEHQAQVFHFAIIPITDDEKIPQVPPKDAAKVNAKRPKPNKKGHKEANKVEIEDISEGPMGLTVKWKPLRQRGVRYLVSYSSNPRFVLGGDEVTGEIEANDDMKCTLGIVELMGEKYLQNKKIPNDKTMIYIVVRAVTDGGEIQSDIHAWDMIHHRHVGHLDKNGHLEHALNLGEDDDLDAAKNHYYTVSSMPPLTGNFIQLRGSQPPPWFPGYFTVHPGVPKVIALDEPNEALDKAWASMGPSQVDSPHGSFLLGKP